MKWLAKLHNTSKEELIQKITILQEERNQEQKALVEWEKKFHTISEISLLMEDNNLTLAEILQKTVNLIPSGWQYQEIACARIVLDNREYKTANFRPSQWKQSEFVLVENNPDGVVEVFYTEQKPEEFVGPFLKEEQCLLKIIAERLGKIATRKLLHEEFTTIFEESPVAKCIIDLDDDNRFKSVNEVFLCLTGYSREELINKKPRQIGLFKNVKDIDRILSDINQQGFVKDFEYEYITKDGLEKSTILNTKVIHINGRNLALASFIDLTEIKKAQNVLKKTEARYRSLVQSQTDIISRSDFEGKLTFANKSFCETFGLNEENIKDFNLSATVFSEDLPRLTEAMNLLKQPPYRKYVEIRNTTTKGVCWFGWDNMAVIDKDGNITEFQSVGRDITNRIKSEEKIRESEKRFQLIAKNVFDVIWMYNLTQDSYTYISPSIKKLRGFTPEEVKQQTLIESVPQKNHEWLEELLREYIIHFEEDNIPRTLVKEIQLVCKDGGLVWAEVSSYLQKNNKGEIEIIGVSRNIDERKKAELKVLEHQTQLNSALKIAGLGYYIVSGIDGHTEFIDERAKKIVGINGNIAGDKGLMEFLFDNIVGEDRKNVLSTYNDIYNERAETAVLVYRYHHPSKGLIWIKHNVEVLQRNKSPQMIKVFGVIQDITEQKQKETELIKAKQKAEHSEIQLKESQAIAKLGNWEFDVETGMFTFNDNFYKIFKTTAEEIGGYQMTVKEYTTRFVHPDDCSLVEEETRKAIETNDPNYAKYIEHKIRYHDASSGYIGARLFIKKDSNGKTVKAYGVNQDITDRKINEQELLKSKEKAEESDRLKSAFLMNVSHEIRTPMNGILGFIDLMNEPDLGEEERRSFIDIVNKSGERLLNTINDIVEISKIEIGDISPVEEEVDVEELMRYHFNFFKLQAVEKGIELKISKQVKGEQAFIKTDKQKLDGILMNLMRNAIKFTNKGTIEIGNYIKDNRFYFYVLDSGRGIPEDKLETIFDRFVQVELGNTRGYEGSGIGLSIVKAYIEALNGTIEVKSEVGKGSTFLFSIPCLPGHPKYKVEEKVVPEEIVPLTHTILIAEDDEVNYYFLENILSPEFNLIHAESGEDALRLFRENPEISLVLMDIKMPGEYDGFDATRKIREINLQIPVIAQTAYAMESDKIKAQDAGCCDYISKPYTPGHLKSLIRKYCCPKFNEKQA